MEPSRFRSLSNLTGPRTVTICSSPRALLLGLAAASLLSMAAVSRAHAEAQLLIEASTGKVLHAENATYPWYPASVTKLMTAYTTLRAIKEGRAAFDTLLTMSRNAVRNGWTASTPWHAGTRCPSPAPCSLALR